MQLNTANGNGANNSSITTSKSAKPARLELVQRDGDREVAQAILVAFSRANELSQQTQTTANLAIIRQAVICGAMLNSKHAEVGRMRWSAWRKEFIPAIAYTTCENWMKLERLSRNGLAGAIEGAKSLRAAYVAVGLFPIQA